MQKDRSRSRCQAVDLSSVYQGFSRDISAEKYSSLYIRVMVMVRVRVRVRVRGSWV